MEKKIGVRGETTKWFKLPRGSITCFKLLYKLDTNLVISQFLLLLLLVVTAT